MDVIWLIFYKISRKHSIHYSPRPPLREGRFTLYTFFNKLSKYLWLHKQGARHVMILSFTAGSNFKQKPSLIGSQTSCLETCTSIKHAHTSNAHIVFQVAFTHWVKFETKSYTNLYSRCYGLWPEPIKCNIKIIFHSQNISNHVHIWTCSI